MCGLLLLCARQGRIQWRENLLLVSDRSPPAPVFILWFMFAEGTLGGSDCTA